MKIQNETITTINLSTYEQDCFSVVDEVLMTLQHHFYNFNSLQSVELAEICDIQELSRVRGILSTIGNNRAFRVK